MTFWTSELFLRRDGKLIKIEKPDDANASSHRDLLFIELRTPWEVGGKTYPAGALLAINLEAFLKGDRQFDVLFEPTDRKSLAGFDTTTQPRDRERTRQRAEPRLRADARERPVETRGTRRRHPKFEHS